VAVEIRATYQGFAIATDDTDWAPWDALSDVRFRGGAAEDRDATKHHDGAEESARAKVTCAQRLRRAERRAAPSFDGAADGGCADQEGTLKGVGP